MIDWNEYAASWDEDEAARAYNVAVFASLARILEAAGASLAGAEVCDFGCGTGLLTEKLAETCRSIDSVDASPGMLEVLGQKISRSGWGHVRALDAFPPDRTYDLIVCSSVCGFLEDYEGTVSRFAEQLRPGGLFVQCDWELDPDADEPMGLTREHIRACLTAAGLDVLAVETAFEIEVADWRMVPLVGAGGLPA